MLLFRSMPVVDDVPSNREFRRYFYSKWGRENAIVSGRVRHAEYPLFTQTLSIKAAWGGRECYYIGGRTVAVDDDNYLIINDQRTYASSLVTDRQMRSFSIFFRPGLAEETLGALRRPVKSDLDAGGDAPAIAVEFAESLHPHDQLVTPLLRYIAAQVDAGVEDEMWYEEQFSFLLERMFRAHGELLALIDSLGLARQVTRREILRRIGWSTDYINTYFMRELSIEDLARAATLSKFHFIRLFRAVHGSTPFAYVQRKRAAEARRLLMSTKLDQDQIAARVGFQSRSTMFRQLRRIAGSGVRGLRGGSRAIQPAYETI